MPAPTPPAAPPGRPPRRRWSPALRVGVALAVALVVVVPVLVVGGLWFAVQGGWDGVRPRAEPKDDEVVTARAESVQGQVARLVALHELATTVTGVDPLRVGEVDRCDEGWTSWKVDDDFTLRCTSTSVVLVGLPAGTDVLATARSLDAALATDWLPQGPTGLVDDDQAFPNGRYTSREDSSTLAVRVDDEWSGSALGFDDPRQIWQRGSLADVVTAGQGHAGPVVSMQLDVRYFVD